MGFLDNILSYGQNPSFVPPGSGMRKPNEQMLMDTIMGAGTDLSRAIPSIHGTAFAGMPSAGQEKMGTPAGPIWEKRIKDLGHYPIHGTQKAQDKWKLDAKLSDEERVGLKKLVEDTLTLEFEALYKQGDYEGASAIAKVLSRDEPKSEGLTFNPYKDKKGFYDGGGLQGQPTDETHPEYGKGLKGGDLERVIADEASPWTFWKGSNLQEQLRTTGKNYSELGAGIWGGAKDAGSGVASGFSDMQGPFDSEVDIQGPFDEDTTYPPLSDFGKGSDIGPALDDLGRVASDAQIGADELIRNVTGSVMEGSVDLARHAVKPLAGLTSGMWALGAQENWDKTYREHTGMLGSVVEAPMRLWAKQPEYFYDDPRNIPTMGLAGVLTDPVGTVKEVADLGPLTGRRPFGTERDRIEKEKEAALKNAFNNQPDTSKEDPELEASLRFLRTRVSLEILQDAGVSLPEPGKDGKVFVDVYNSTDDTWDQVQVDTETGLTTFVESINAMNPDGVTINLTGPGETASAADIQKLVKAGRIRVTKDGVTTVQGTMLNDPSAPPALRKAGAEAEQAYNSADPNTRGEPLDFFAKMLSQTMGDISDIREKLVQTDRKIKEVLGRTPHWLEVVATLLVEAYAASVGQSGIGAKMLQQYKAVKRQEVSDIQKQQTTLMSLMGQYQRSAVDLYTQARADERAGYKDVQEMIKQDKLVTKPYMDAHKDLDVRMDKVINDAKSYDRIELSKDHIDFTGMKDAPMTQARKARYEYAEYIKNRATLEVKRMYKQQRILAFMEAKQGKLGHRQSLTPGILYMSGEMAKLINLVQWYDSKLSHSYRGKKAPLDEPSAIPKYYDYTLPVLNRDDTGKIPAGDMFVKAHGIQGLLDAQNRLESAAKNGMDTPGISRAIGLARKLIKSYYYRK